MGKVQQKKIVEFIKKFLKSKNINVSKIILFGSRIYGKAHKDSDVDVLIISKNFEGKSLFKKVNMAGELHWALVDEFFLPFDLLYYTPSDWRKAGSVILHEAKKTGVVYS